jgi:hypothetical protein
MHLTHKRPLEEPGSPAFACGNVLISPTFEFGPTEFDGGPGDPGDCGHPGWVNAWIDLGGEG